MFWEVDEEAKRSGADQGGYEQVGGYDIGQIKNTEIGRLGGGK